MIEVCGLIPVPTPGTPIRATANILQDANGVKYDPTKVSVHAALFQAWHLNVGKIYIGLAGMNTGSGAGVSAVLAIPTDNSIPAYSISLTLSPAGVDLSKLWIDAASGGDGVLLTLLVT